MRNCELKRAIAGVSMVTLIFIIVFVALAVSLPTRYDIATRTALACPDAPTPYYAPSPAPTPRQIKHDGQVKSGTLYLPFDPVATDWADYKFAKDAVSNDDTDTYYEWVTTPTPPHWASSPVDDTHWNNPVGQYGSWNNGVFYAAPTPPANPGTVNLSARWIDENNNPPSNPTGWGGSSDDGTLGPTAGAVTVTLVGIVDITPSVTEGEGSWIGSTFYVKAGSIVQFQAIPFPYGAEWPSGKPVWGGTAGISGTGPTKSKTFNSQGPFTVTAEASSNGSDRITIDVYVYKIDLDIRETAQPQNRVGRDDPRTPTNTINKILIWHNSGANTVSFDLIKPPDITGYVWVMIEDRNNLNSNMPHFERLDSSSKTFTYTVKEDNDNNDDDSDLVVRYGIDLNSDNVLSGSEIKGRIISTA